MSQRSSINDRDIMESIALLVFTKTIEFVERHAMIVISGPDERAVDLRMVESFLELFDGINCHSQPHNLGT